MDQWYDTRVFAGLLVIAVLVVIAWRASAAERTRPVAFGLFWFAVALTPASSVVPLSEVANEHRIFFPYLGLALAVVWGALVWAERWVRAWPRVGTVTASVVALGVLTGHAVGTYQRNTVWASGESLWADVVEKSPNNGRAWMNYGLSQMSLGRYARAKELFEKAQITLTNYARLDVNLAIATNRLGDLEAAERHFQRAEELDPNYAAGFYYHARWLIERGRSDEAIPRLERSLRLSPALAAPRALLMNLYYAIGADADLDRVVRETLAASPADLIASAYAAGGTPGTADDADADARLQSGLEFTNQTRHLEAAVAYRYALEDDPDHADSLNNYGWTLDTLGFHEAAVEWLERAVAVSPGDGRAANNLVVARRNLEVGQ